MNLCNTLLLGLGLLTVSAAVPAADPLPASAVCAPLTWTQAEFFGNWAPVKQQAADYQGEGYTDWRLPTIAEYQTAFADGSFGQMTPNVTNWHLWTSRSQGNKAWAVTVATDANGNVIASQSGQAAVWGKSSYFHAKFVRP